jgi:hypothetical protein
VWAVQSGDLIWVFISSACSKCRAASSYRDSVVARSPSRRETEPTDKRKPVTPT